MRTVGRFFTRPTTSAGFLLSMTLWCIASCERAHAAKARRERTNACWRQTPCPSTPVGDSVSLGELWRLRPTRPNRSVGTRHVTPLDVTVCVTAPNARAGGVGCRLLFKCRLLRNQPTSGECVLPQCCRLLE
uniref:Putative secreted protein n=1 Tax=Ixodes ricinus TaxID=34613 RepID=A0A6B0US28_IXORI